MPNIKEHKVGDYTLVYDFDALESAEEHVGPLAELLVDPIKASKFKTIRVLFWAGLRRKHEIDMDKIGPIVDELGLTKVSQAIQVAMKKAYPQLNPDDPGGKPKAE